MKIAGSFSFMFNKLRNLLKIIYKKIKKQSHK